MHIVRDEEPAPDQLQGLILNLQNAKVQVEAMQQALAHAQGALTRYMEEHQRKTVRTSADGYILQATYKQQTSVKIDEPGLRKKMGASAYDKYTMKKLDRKKLEAALDDDAALRLVVAPYVNVTKSAPFIQLTMKEDKAEDG